MKKSTYLSLAILLGILLLILSKFVHFPYPLMAVSGIAISLQFGIILTLAVHYSPTPTDPQYLPSVSVLVPVYNEPFEIVKNTIEHILMSDYRGLVEVIVVDDGSKKKLQDQLKQLERGNVTVILFDQNRGNKFARAEGILHSLHDIVVFVDSDTYVTPHGIRELVQPFAEETTGAVSGHLHVLEPNNLIRKLQAGWYFTGFRVHRGAEDRLGMVTCCPGAFSAYRRSVITEEILEEWLYGEFLGLEVTAGVDRALTNLIMREHAVRYQYTAEAYTIAPDSLGQFWRQQVRWTKSWIRENLFALTYLYRRGWVSFLFYLTVFLRVIGYGMLFLMLFYEPFIMQDFGTTITYFAGLSLVGLIYGSFSWQKSYGIYRVIFPLFYCWFSLPLFFYSLYSLRSHSWMTR